MYVRGSVTEVFRWGGCWAPRERIRPKDARRECARDLTVAANVFDLESTLPTGGTAVRGRCSRSMERAGGGGEGEGGDDGGCGGWWWWCRAAATSGCACRAWRWNGGRVAARGRGEGERRAGDVVSAGGMLLACAWERGGMGWRVPWWAQEEDGMESVGITTTSSEQQQQRGGSPGLAGRWTLDRC